MSRATIVRQLNIDPALSHLGWSITDYNVEQGVMSVYRFGTLEATRIVSKVAFKEEVEMYTKRMVTLKMIRDHFKLLMGEFKPDFVTSEDAFMYMRRPTAFSALIQCISTIEFFLMNEYKKKLYRVAPKAAKHCLTGSGSVGKDPIQQTIFTKDDIVFKQRKQAEKLGEHEADSISVGYFFCKNILPGIIAQPQLIKEKIKN